MKCDICHRPLSGQDAQRRAEYRLQPDGSIKVFGKSMPDGPLAAATGRLVKVRHSGCYWAQAKREQRAAQ